MVSRKFKVGRQVEIDVKAVGGVGKRARRRRRRARLRAGAVGRGLNGVRDVGREMVSQPGRGLVGLSRNPIPAGYTFSSPSTSLKINGVSGDYMTVARCEMVAAFTAKTTDTFSAPEANPLIPSFCPWLSGVAANYSKWRWLSFRAYYVPVVGTNTSGAVGYGFGYDFAEQTPTSLTVFAAFDQVKIHASWTTAEDGAVLDTGRFTKDWYPYIGKGPFTTAVTVPNNRNIYAPAYLSFYEAGSSATENSVVGFMWYDYVVELADPISSTLQPQT